MDGTEGFSGSGNGKVRLTAPLTSDTGIWFDLSPAEARNLASALVAAPSNLQREW